MKVLILGMASNGKSEVAKILGEEFGIKSEDSSKAALRIFLYDILNEKYNLKYKSMDEAYEDRVNHRGKWYGEICEYNKDDKTRLAKEILKENDIYVGMRDKEQLEECMKQGLFDLYLGVFNYRVPPEPPTSNTVDIAIYSDIIITNNGSLESLRYKVKEIGKFIMSKTKNNV